MSFNLQNILDELKSLAIGGLAPEEIDAKISAAVKPLADKQSSDEATISAIQEAITALQNGETDQGSAIQAIVDALPKAPATSDEDTAQV